MGLPGAGSKQFQPTPPDKGSFPLDHYGDCNVEMQAFMGCLAAHGQDYRECKLQSKAYLQCRMDRNLMTKEDLSKLGFQSSTAATATTTTATATPAAAGSSASASASTKQQ